MVTRIYVASAEGGTGKSIVAAGILDQLSRSGRRVAVFRPLIRRSDERDAILSALLAHASIGLPHETCVGMDYEQFHADTDEALRILVERAATIETECDVLLVVGSDYTDVGSPTELAMNGRIAANLAAAVVLVVGGRSAEGGARSPAEIAEVERVALAELLLEHAPVSAIVVNRADPENLAAIAAAAADAAGGRPSWVVAEDPELTSPLLTRIFESVDATLASGDTGQLERPVRGVVVAAMSLENVLPRLVEGGLLVVAGDRSEVLLGAIVAHTSSTFPSLAGVLVHGGIPINSQVERLIAGLDARLPIGTTDLGTYDTAVRITGARSRLIADSPAKYDLALSLFGRHVEATALEAAMTATLPTVLTPARFEHSLAERARGRRMRIVLPEGEDDRILRAAAIASSRGIAELTILGDEPTIRCRADEAGIELDEVQVVSPLDPALLSRFVDEYVRLRRHKGVSKAEAESKLLDPSYFGTMMVHLGLADGMVSGAIHSTAQTMRPAFEIIKTGPTVSLASSVFFMALADRVLVYGDCAIVPQPTAAQLADIAVSSAATARSFGIEPVVAMLSYSTGTSGAGTDVDDVRAATALVRERVPDLPVVGPIQYDAAADPMVAAAKIPDSDAAGHATVYVFPDLNTGNNTYKAVQRTAGAVAIGPVLQGLAKPVNDLSRGASVRDLVNTIAITAIQAQELR